MERRSFLKRMTHLLGALFGAVIGIPALSFLIDPRHRPAPDGAFKRVARLSDLGGKTPDPVVIRQVVVRDIRRDAWTLHPNDVLGRVWLVRRGDAVEAYTTICPHLGCSINFEEKSHRFICPCHGGTFDISCHRVAEEDLGRTNPAPRDMDALEIRTVEIPGEDDSVIEVKYENYVEGRPDRVKKT